MTSHPSQPYAELLEAHGFRFIITDGHAKKEFPRANHYRSKAHPHSRDTRFSNVDDLLNACAMHEHVNVKAFVPAGYVLIDVDRHGSNGFKALADVEHELPTTYSETTPTNGGHYIYKLPDDCAAFQGNLTHEFHSLTGVEIISGPNNPFLIAESIIKGKGRYILTHEGPIVDAPAWVVDIVRARLAVELSKRKLRELHQARPIAQDTRRRAGPYGQTALINEAAEIGRATQGTRHNTMIKSAFKIGQLVPHYLDQQTAIQKLTNATDGWHGNIEQREREITKAIEQGMTKPRFIREIDQAEDTRQALSHMLEAMRNAQWGGYVYCKDKSKGKDVKVAMSNIYAVVNGMLDTAERAETLSIDYSVRRAAEMARMARNTSMKALWGARSIDLITLESEFYESKANTYRLDITGFMRLLIGGKLKSMTSEPVGDIVEQAESSPPASIPPHRLICHTFELSAKWSDLGVFERSFNRTFESDGQEITVSYYGLGKSAWLIVDALLEGPKSTVEIMASTGLSHATAKRLINVLDVNGIVKRATKRGGVHEIAPDADKAARAVAESGDAAHRYNRRKQRHDGERASYLTKLEDKRRNAISHDTSPYDDQEPVDPSVIVPTKRYTKYVPEVATNQEVKEVTQSMQLVRRVTVTEEFAPMPVLAEGENTEVDRKGAAVAILMKGCREEIAVIAGMMKATGCSIDAARQSLANVVRDGYVRCKDGVYFSAFVPEGQSGIDWDDVAFGANNR